MSIYHHGLSSIKRDINCVLLEVSINTFRDSRFLQKIFKVSHMRIERKIEEYRKSNGARISKFSRLLFERRTKDSHGKSNLEQPKYSISERDRRNQSSQLRIKLRILLKYPSMDHDGETKRRNLSTDDPKFRFRVPFPYILVYLYSKTVNFTFGKSSDRKLHFCKIIFYKDL